MDSKKDTDSGAISPNSSIWRGVEGPRAMERSRVTMEVTVGVDGRVTGGVTGGVTVTVDETGSAAVGDGSKGANVANPPNAKNPRRVVDVPSVNAGAVISGWAVRGVVYFSCKAVVYGRVVTSTQKW